MSDSQPAADITTFAAFGTVMSLLAMIGLIGNIICFRMTKRLKRNKPSLALVLNLNMSDIIVALISLTAFMLQHTASYIGVDIDVIVHKIFWSILVGLGNVTLLTLTGLAGDCFVALRWPLHYKEIATTRTVNIYITAIWICSVFAGGGDFIAALSRTGPTGSFTDAIHETIVFTGRDFTVTELLTASITMLLSNSLSFVCLIMMIVMYTYILCKIRQILADRTLSKQGGFKSEINAVRTTLMIFTSFLLLWVPTLVVNIVSVANPNFLSKLSFTEASFIGYTADTLLMVHSIIDALIYGVRVKKTISRQRKSRKNQAWYSRANTFRKTTSSDSDKTSPADLEDKVATALGSKITNQIGRSSARASRVAKLTTVSETSESQLTELPMYEQMAGSHHKLSANGNHHLHNECNPPHTVLVINSITANDETDENLDSSSSQHSPESYATHKYKSVPALNDDDSSEDIPENILIRQSRFSPNLGEKHKSINTVEDEDGYQTGSDNLSTSCDKIANSLYNSPQTSPKETNRHVTTNTPGGESNHNSLLTIPAESKPRRSSLKRTTVGPKSASNSPERTVRFSTEAESTEGRDNKTSKVDRADSPAKKVPTNTKLQTLVISSKALPEIPMVIIERLKTSKTMAQDDKVVGIENGGFEKAEFQDHNGLDTSVISSAHHDLELSTLYTSAIAPRRGKAPNQADYRPDSPCLCCSLNSSHVLQCTKF